MNSRSSSRHAYEDSGHNSSQIERLHNTVDSEEYSYIEPDRVRIERPIPNNTEEDYTYEESTGLATDNLYEPLPSTSGDNLELHENDCYEATLETQGHFVVNENESYQPIDAPEVHFEINVNESYQNSVEMRQNQSYETLPSNVNNPVMLNHPEVVGNDSESTGLATDNLYEPLPSTTGEHIDLHENDCYETTSEPQGHFVVNENESYRVNGVPEVHFEVSLNESYQNNVNNGDDQSLPPSNLSNPERQQQIDSSFRENQSVPIEIRENWSNEAIFHSNNAEEHHSQPPSYQNRPPMEMGENPSYRVPPSRANQVVVVNQPHPPPRVAAVLPPRAPSPAVLVFAIVLTFAMIVQCCIPLIMCALPGLILAMVGYSMGSYKRYGHTGRAYNGVSLCCNVTALFFYFMIVFAGVVNTLAFYSILYTSNVATSSSRTPAPTRG